MSADASLLESQRPAAAPEQRWARLLVNPVSGPGGAVAELPTIIAALEGAGLRVVLSFTSSETSPTAMAAQAVHDGFDLVIVAGGDGTISAVAQGLWYTKVPLGILPLGTYNNIARSLGIPDDLNRAIETVLQGRPWRVDGALANNTAFMEVAGLGLDAALFPMAEQIKDGGWHQLVAAARMLRLYQPRRLRIELADGQRFVTRPLLTIVSNMPYFGMRFAVAPDARPDSGTLVLSVFDNFTKLQLLRHFIAVANGWRGLEPHISTYHSPRFTITTPSGTRLPVQVDGRVVERSPVRFEVVPQALSVLVPES